MGRILATKLYLNGDGEEGFEPLGSTAPQRRWTPEALRRRPEGEGRMARVNPTLSAKIFGHLVYGGSRLHLRDDWSRTPSGPEGSSGSDIMSGAEVLRARAASHWPHLPRRHTAMARPAMARPSETAPVKLTVL